MAKECYNSIQVKKWSRQEPSSNDSLSWSPARNVKEKRTPGSLKHGQMMLFSSYRTVLIWETAPFLNSRTWRHSLSLSYSTLGALKRMWQWPKPSRFFLTENLGWQVKYRFWSKLRNSSLYSTARANLRRGIKSSFSIRTNSNQLATVFRVFH